MSVRATGTVTPVRVREWQRVHSLVADMGAVTVITTCERMELVHERAVCLDGFAMFDVRRHLPVAHVADGPPSLLRAHVPLDLHSSSRLTRALVSKKKSSSLSRMSAPTVDPASANFAVAGGKSSHTIAIKIKTSDDALYKVRPPTVARRHTVTRR